jgi:hypothetical protein
VSLWVDFFRRYDQKFDGSIFQEYRLWEQVLWEAISNNYYKLTSRSRLEERKNSADSQIANRFREKIILKFPVTTLTEYYLVLAEEIFFQLNQPTWVVNRIFSQNRASIGLQIPINKSMSYEAGYLNQYQYGNPNQMSNVLYVNLALNID